MYWKRGVAKWDAYPPYVRWAGGHLSSGSSKFSNPVDIKWTKEWKRAGLGGACRYRPLLFPPSPISRGCILMLRKLVTVSLFTQKESPRFPAVYDSKGNQISSEEAYIRFGSTSVHSRFFCLRRPFQFNHDHLRHSQPASPYCSSS
jgi:hypothetical protein